jgi:hypothetical protein
MTNDPSSPWRTWARYRVADAWDETAGFLVATHPLTEDLPLYALRHRVPPRPLRPSSTSAHGTSGLDVFTARV